MPPGATMTAMTTPAPEETRPPSNSALLHVVSAGLRPDLEGEALATAVALASSLLEVEGARAVRVAQSASHLLVATLLEGRDALEPFAASPQHMAFIMRGVARVTSGMWSAAVELERPTFSLDGAAALAVLGLRAADEVYEWQVRAALDDIDALPGVAASGVTFEERDRFRAAGAVLLRGEDTERFTAGLERARHAWGPLAATLEVAVAPLVETSTDRDAS